MTPEVVFRRHMRQRRNVLGLRQDDLAARLGLHGSAVSKIESGDRLVRLDEAAAIASALGSTIDAMATPPSPVAGLLPALWYIRTGGAS